MQNVALITGASSGIGKEFARIHAERGGDLILVARREDKLSELKDELEAKHKISALVIPMDLNDEAAPQQIFDELQQKNIEIDILINNAGFGGRGKFHEREWASDRSMIQVDIIALTALTRLFLPGFVARNKGKILNVSSSAALMPGPLQAVYYASKAFVTNFSNGVAEELHDTDVTVTALMPGATESEFASTSDMDATKLFKDTKPAREIAEAGYIGMLSGKLDVIAGVPGIMKLAIKIMPKQAMMKQVRQMQEVD